VPADLAAVSDVYRRVSHADDHANLLVYPEHLILGPDGLNEARTQVAEENGSVVGFATWADAAGVLELEDLFVDPDCRRQGIAAALVREIVDILRARGVERMEVTANPHAMGFYTAVGFTDCWDSMTAAPSHSDAVALPRRTLRAACWWLGDRSSLAAAAVLQKTWLDRRLGLA
jgi:ribosomal protein S18 acetylase RimI-like enzyme